MEVAFEILVDRTKHQSFLTWNRNLAAVRTRSAGNSKGIVRRRLYHAKACWEDGRSVVSEIPDHRNHLQRNFAGWLAPWLIRGMDNN